MRSLRVAAVQVTSRDGQPEENLENAARFVLEARSRGAELVLCPEFLATGYVFDESIWRMAEPRGGLTERWLEDRAREHDIVIGASYLEADGDDFFNTFSLFGPGGELLGRVKKQSLPFFEGWFFTPCSEPKVIDTPFGKVGVGICNDTQTAAFLQHVASEKPDLLLMPHSAPTPELPLVKKLFELVEVEQLRRTPARYARALGVPVVMSNKVSSVPSKTPIPLVPGLRVPLCFHGHSGIVDGDGNVRATLADEEGVLVADVTLDPDSKRDFRPGQNGYWSFPPKALARSAGQLLRTLDALGRRAYRKNPRRAAAARACAPPR
jgi:N-carbamoylputrescine amidase